MKIRTHSHKHAEAVIPIEAGAEWAELLDVISSVSDEDLIERFESRARPGKSISESINSLLRERLVAKGWLDEAPIFQDSGYRDKRWRLDFAKGLIAVEVAFNHGEAIAWNLLKPVLASEYNHVEKAIQTRVGVIICATEEMKTAGGFDSAVGTFEKFGRYLIPLQNPLTVPLMLVGLEAPTSFRIDHTKVGGKMVGSVARF